MQKPRGLFVPSFVLKCVSLTTLFITFFTLIGGTATAFGRSFHPHHRVFQYENVEFYGQCPSPVRRFYLQNYSWLPPLPRLSSGNHGAYLFWTAHQPEGYERIPYVPGINLPQKDDMLVLGQSSHNRYGHVAVVASASEIEITVVDSNWVGGERGGIHSLSLNDEPPTILGWYRPLSRESLDSASTEDNDPEKPGQLCQDAADTATSTTAPQAGLSGYLTEGTSHSTSQPLAASSKGSGTFLNPEAPVDQVASPQLQTSGSLRNTYRPSGSLAYLWSDRPRSVSYANRHQSLKL